MGMKLALCTIVLGTLAQASSQARLSVSEEVIDRTKSIRGRPRTQRKIIVHTNSPPVRQRYTLHEPEPLPYAARQSWHSIIDHEIKQDKERRRRKDAALDKKDIQESQMELARWAMAANHKRIAAAPDARDELIRSRMQST